MPQQAAACHFRFASEIGFQNHTVIGFTAGQPGKGEIRVRIHNVSLNFHDYNVAAGILPAQAGRILMSDGAGTVESVGEGVTDFQPGDAVVSTFFPDWDKGECPLAGFSRTPAVRDQPASIIAFSRYHP